MISSRFPVFTGILAEKPLTVKGKFDRITHGNTVSRVHGQEKEGERMNITLRGYQKEALEAIQAQPPGSYLLQLATGLG